MTATDRAIQQGKESLVLALKILWDSDSLQHVMGETAKQRARQWKADIRAHGLDFAKAVRQERRRLLFEELGSKPSQQPYIDECMPADRP
jgi:hypothetical protein